MMDKSSMIFVVLTILLVATIIAFGGSPSDKVEMPHDPTKDFSAKWRYYESPNEPKPPSEKEILSSYIASKYKVDKDLSEEIVQTVYRHTESTNIKPKLILAVIAVESSFILESKSHAGALGLMQIMPFNNPGVTLEDNILSGICLLQTYQRALKSDTDAVMAYNIGIGNFKRGMRNHKYVEKVLKEELEFIEVSRF